jgi:hypothetical protein
MAYQFNPFTGTLDITNSSSELNALYVQKAGDTMTGNLNMQGNFLIFTASDGTVYTMTVNPSGAVLTAVQSSGGGGKNSGVPIGFPNLGLTYP